MTASSPDSLIATLVAADGYYLYREKLAFNVQSADAVIDHVELPPSELIDDPLFGRVPVYFGAIQVPITLDIPPGSSSDMLTLDIAYQGCNDPVGVCYPPEQNPCPFHSMCQLKHILKPAGVTVRQNPQALGHQKARLSVSCLVKVTPGH